ncbi:MAG: 16S rRNA (guanine(966)-N(2))-methyltransferase RsmD [Akkermansiaceae bacterium]|nr:16S rRNA (guanine(966)-N(2))-methyltransferase RsmD [Akkermansiaceae bacterium]
MRIISGSAGRTAIKVPATVTRPTTDFLRQAIFSILGEAVIDASVLDLYAGSGAIGLEALSRGASQCTFVESQRQACKIIEGNLVKSRLEGGRVTCSQALPFLRRDAAQYDLIFADPPYWKHYGDDDHILDLLEPVAPRLKPEGWLIAEAASRYKAPTPESLKLVDRREYGSSSILLYALASNP